MVNVTSATSGRHCLSHPLGWDKLRAMNKPRKPVRTGTIRAIAYIRVSTKAQANPVPGWSISGASASGTSRRRAGSSWKSSRTRADRAPRHRTAALASAARRRCSMRVTPTRRYHRGRPREQEHAGIRDPGQTFRRPGLALHTLDVPLDPATPIGKAMRDTLATFAQLERDFISARTREGLAIKMEQPDFQIGLAGERRRRGHQPHPRPADQRPVVA